MDNLDIVVHETDEGGYWAEIPAMPGCITEGDTLEETKANIREAAEVWLATKLEWILTRGTTTTVPHHGNRKLAQGTLNAIFNQAGIPKPQR